MCVCGGGGGGGGSNHLNIKTNNSAVNLVIIRSFKLRDCLKHLWTTFGYRIETVNVSIKIHIMDINTTAPQTRNKLQKLRDGSMHF